MTKPPRIFSTFYKYYTNLIYIILKAAENKCFLPRYDG